MYPIFRMAKEIVLTRKAAPLPLTGTHVSRHICWPWDLDMWMELNNGRTLTLLDLARLPLAMRVGLGRAMRQRRWGLTIAGISVRYRQRIRAFDRFETRSRVAGWDDRFIYIVQSIWRGDTCTTQALYRSAVTDATGIVAPADVAAELGAPPDSPAMPAWVANWIKAEATRPWPPAHGE